MGLLAAVLTEHRGFYKMDARVLDQKNLSGRHAAGGRARVPQYSSASWAFVRITGPAVNAGATPSGSFAEMRCDADV